MTQPGPFTMMFESPPCPARSKPLNARIVPDGFVVDEIELLHPFSDNWYDHLADIRRRMEERMYGVSRMPPDIFEAAEYFRNREWTRMMTDEELARMQGFDRRCQHGRVGPCIECHSEEVHRRARFDGHRFNPATFVCRDCASSAKAVHDGLVPECGVEIINDSADQRGLNAKPVRTRHA